MIIKVCQFTAQAEGGRLVQVFHPGEMEKAASFFGMGKTAAPMLPKVQQYLEQLAPHPNKIYVLVNALGAGEFWGSNINGDYFPESSLIHKGMDWGYETFYNAYPFKHHVNKDPSRSFGKVELACWHDDMKRVELVVSVDRELALKFGAQDVVDKLEQGMFPDVSMGCKVPYDLCSICLDWKSYRRAQSTFEPGKHKTVGQAVLLSHRKTPIRGVSVTRDDYCEHLGKMLNKILPDGRKVYAINDYPRFFDISFVFIGADKTAKVMAKLATAHIGSGAAVPSWYVAEQLGYQPETEKGFEKAASAQTHVSMEKSAGISEVLAALREKKASQRKRAEIIKDVAPSQFGGKAVPTNLPCKDLPDDVLDRLGEHPSLSEALSTPSSMGIVLKPREFQRVLTIHMGQRSLADELDSQGLTIPPVDDVAPAAPMGAQHFSDILKKLLLPHIGERSMLEPPLKRRIIQITVSGGPTVNEGPVKLASVTPFLEKISAAYNGYIEDTLGCLYTAEHVIEQNPDLAAKVFNVGVGDLFQKTAAGMDPAVVFGSIAGGYALSQYADWKRRKAMMGSGPPIGAVTDMVAQNPKMLMALAGLVALQQQGSSIPRRLGAGIKGLITGN